MEEHLKLIMLLYQYMVFLSLKLKTIMVGFLVVNIAGVDDKMELTENDK